MNKSSKYPFYIALDSMEGLILGQHVYIEKDIGQNEVKEGLWIPDYFIVEENNEYFVWAANSKDKLEKRKIEIGEKDEKLGKYQIKKGLSLEDYIAVPSEDLTEGVSVNKFDTVEIPVDTEENSEDLNQEENVDTTSEIQTEENAGV